MAEIEDWSQVAASNNDVSPDGWPEGMTRSGVNNSAREGMAVVRRFYEAPEWLDLLTEKDDSYVVTKDTDTAVKAVSAGTSSAVLKFPDGSRVRIRESVGGTYLYGFVNGTPGFSVSTTTIEVDVDGGTVVDVNTDNIEIAVFRDIVGRAAFSPIGVTLAQDPPEIPSIDDLGDIVTLDNGQVDALTLQGQTLAQVVGSAEGGNRNLLTNTQFKIWQRGTSITSATTYKNNDNAYVCDRWRLLSGIGVSHVNDLVNVSQNTADRPEGFWSTLNMTGTATLAGGPNSQRVGIFQVLESSDSQTLRSDAVSFSFYCKVTGVVTNVRGMVLKWTGSPDATIGDPIADWGPVGDATGPSLNANWFKVMDTGPMAASATWTRYTANVQGIDLTTHTNAINFAVLIYTDDQTMILADTFRVSGVQLELGQTSADFQDTGTAAELARCQRFFNKTFDYSVAPADNTTLNGAVQEQALGNSYTPTWNFVTPMRSVPTVVIYNPLFATPLEITRYTNAGAPLLSQVFTPLFSTVGTRSASWIVAVGGSNQYNGLHATADAEI